MTINAGPAHQKCRFYENMKHITIGKMHLEFLSTECRRKTVMVILYFEDKGSRGKQQINYLRILSKKWQNKENK